MQWERGCVQGRPYRGCRKVAGRGKGKEGADLPIGAHNEFANEGVNFALFFGGFGAVGAFGAPVFRQNW